MNDGSATEVGDTMALDQIKNYFWLYAAQENINTSNGRHGPGKTPPVALKHGQSPKIYRMGGHAPTKRVGHRIQIRASMVIHHAFWVSRGARRVIKGYGIPFIRGQGPRVVRVPATQK